MTSNTLSRTQFSCMLSIKRVLWTARKRKKIFCSILFLIFVVVVLHPQYKYSYQIIYWRSTKSNNSSKTTQPFDYCDFREIARIIFVSCVFQNNQKDATLQNLKLAKISLEHFWGCFSKVFNSKDISSSKHFSEMLWIYKFMFIVPSTYLSYNLYAWFNKS